MSARLAVLLLLLPNAATALTLEECRASAEREHPQVALARAAAAAAEARSTIARAPLWPTLSAEGSFAASKGSAAGLGGALPAAGGSLAGPADLELWTGALVARQTIFDFGRSWNAAGAAEGQERAARLELFAARLRLGVEAESAFRTAIAAERLVQTALDAEARAKSALDRAKARVELGLRPPLDARRAEVELASAELGRIAAENARELTRLRVAAACGREALPATEALVVPPAPEAPTATDAELLAAVEARPELAAATARVAAADEALDAAWSTWRPALGAQGQLLERGRAIDATEPGWSATVTLSVPLFAGFADEARVREAEANLAGAQAALVQLRRIAEQEHRAARQAWLEAVARRAAAERLLQASSEGLALADGRYETGLGDVVEVADAQLALAQAQATVVRAELDLAIAAAQLRRLLTKAGTDE